MQVGWDGAVNAHEVVPGIVRMGRREFVTEAGWREALSAGFRTVVDLRASRELRPRPGDQEVPDAVRAHLQVVAAPTEDPDHPEFERYLGPYLDHPRDYGRYLLLFGDLVAAALLAVATAPGPVVMHCAAGRDRTGLVVALGQLLAGWPVAEIVAGYVAGAEGSNARLADHPHPIERHLEGAEWESWIGERVAALETWLAETDAAAFLAEEGLDADAIAAIRARFRRPVTEDAPN